MIIPCCRNKWLHLFISIVSICMLVTVILLGVYLFPDIIKQQVDKNMRLDDDNDQYERFEKLPFPIIFKVYMFHVKNPEEIENKKAKPILEERGPYIYKQARQKEIIKFNNTEDTISYYQKEVFTFDEDASSPLKDTDNITMLNVAAWSIIQEKEDDITQAVIAGCLSEMFPKEKYPSFFVTKKVKEFLFDGLDFCKNPGFLCGIACNTIRDLKKKNIDPEPDYLRFSYFNYKNNTPDGLYTVNRGRKDIDQLGHIIRWNNVVYTDFWKHNGTKPMECDHVMGTDSTLYPPRLTKNDIISIYATDICRHVDIYFVEEKNYKGIEGYVYGTRNDTLISDNPEENCYCTKEIKNATGNFSCYLDGVIGVKRCIGAPVLLSFPHFLWADKKYLDGVVMDPPNEEEHKIFLHVEPNTGVPLRGNKRVQLNAVLRPVNQVTTTNNFPRTVLPLCWIDEGFELPDKYITVLNDLYFNKVTLVAGLEYGLVGLFSLIAGITGALFIYFCVCDPSKKYA